MKESMWPVFGSCIGKPCGGSGDAVRGGMNDSGGDVKGL